MLVVSIKVAVDGVKEAAVEDVAEDEVAVEEAVEATATEMADSKARGLVVHQVASVAIRTVTVAIRATITAMGEQAMATVMEITRNKMVQVIPTGLVETPTRIKIAENSHMISHSDGGSM